MHDRPLDRQHVSPLLRILIPVFPIATAILGLSYTFTPRNRWLASPVFRVANDILPMPCWGAAFLTVTSILLIGIALQRRALYERGLAILVALLVVWALVFATAIAGQGSFTAWLWPAFGATVAAGTIRELTTPRERQ